MADCTGGVPSKTGPTRSIGLNIEFPSSYEGVEVVGVELPFAYVRPETTIEPHSCTANLKLSDGREVEADIRFSMRPHEYGSGDGEG